MKNPQNWNLDTAMAWAIALTDLNMTEREFAIACQKSLSQEWFPTAPYDFLMLARAETVKQYPEIRAAYVEAAQKRYPHAVVYETAQRVGTWELSTMPETETWAMWEHIYPKVCQEHASGTEFTLPVAKCIEHVPPTPATAEQADEYLAKIKKMLGGVK